MSPKKVSFDLKFPSGIILFYFSKNETEREASLGKSVF
jgi:hypothetical protein